MIEDESVKNLRKSIFEKLPRLVGDFGLDYKISDKPLLEWMREEFKYRKENNLPDSIGRE